MTKKKSNSKSPPINTGALPKPANGQGDTYWSDEEIGACEVVQFAPSYKKKTCVCQIERFRSRMVAEENERIEKICDRCETQNGLCVATRTDRDCPHEKEMYSARKSEREKIE
jgi:hypothetical protein